MPTEMNTETVKLKIGDKAPDFSLPGVDGKSCSLNDFRGKKILVIMFMCNHCPYVQGSLERIKAIQSDFGIKGVQVVGINSNDEINYPDDSFEKMIETSKSKKINFRDSVREKKISPPVCVLFHYSCAMFLLAATHAEYMLSQEVMQWGRAAERLIPNRITAQRMLKRPESMGASSHFAKNSLRFRPTVKACQYQAIFISMDCVHFRFSTRECYCELRALEAPSTFSSIDH